MENVEEPQRVKPKVIVERFKISQSQFFKRVARGDFHRYEDGTFDVDNLVAGGLQERQVESEPEPEEPLEAPPEMTVAIESLTRENERLEKLLEQSRERELTWNERERTWNDKEATLMRQLDQGQALLLNEQKNIQLLLPAGRDRSAWRRFTNRWKNKE